MKVRGALHAAFWVVLVLAAGDVIAADQPAGSVHSPVVYLAVGSRPPASHTGLLSWELYRQAFLIAARDGLGLATRDESLREWKVAPPKELLTPSLRGSEFFINSAAGDSAVWQGVVDPAIWPDNCAAIAVAAEKLSREDFCAALRKAGWSGKGNVIRPGAPELPQVEQTLGQMDELSQFAVLRIAHAAISETGESPARLGLLVRAYSNLSQLTRFQLSAQSEVYAARALLYAQRMVAADPNSAIALWHLAYAQAMVGLPKVALADLKQAAQLSPTGAPKWVALLEPYCKYQPQRLRDLAAADPEMSPQAWFLAFVSVAGGGCQGEIMTSGRAALSHDPTCIRIVDAMCEETGPGMTDQLIDQSGTILSQMLGNRLGQMPGLPADVNDLIQHQRQQEGNPLGREMVCQKLMEVGEADKDRGEPSWAALGRLIQEITFVQVQWQVQFVAQQLGTDASEEVNRNRPLILSHPYRRLIDAYGLLHGREMAELQDAVMDYSTEQLTPSFLHMRNLTQAVQRLTGKSTNLIYPAVVRNLDATSYATERLLVETPTPRPEDLTLAMTILASVSPDSPTLLEQEIRRHWDAAKAAQWETDGGDHAQVALALAQQFAQAKQWSDAERCYKKYISLSPDLRGYQGLADVYEQQKLNDQWLATMKEYLTQPDYGLQHAWTQAQIADFLMDSGNFDQALPYAQAAAATGAGWATSCEAAVDAGLGKWDEAEKLITDETTYYSSNPWLWYDWCVRTNHGNRAAAADATQAFFSLHEEKIGNVDLMEWACLSLLQKQNDQIVTRFEKCADSNPSPISQLHLAVIADFMRDIDTRDYALSLIPARPKVIAPFEHVAAALRDAAAAGPDVEPKDSVINTALRGTTPINRVSICYLVGRWHETRGDKTGAIVYYRRGFTSYNTNTPDLTLTGEALRQNGVDPGTLEQTSKGPGKRLWLEP